MRPLGVLKRLLLLAMVVGLVVPASWYVVCTTPEGDRHVELAHQVGVHHHEADHAGTHDCPNAGEAAHDCGSECSGDSCPDAPECGDACADAELGADCTTSHAGKLSVPPPQLVLLHVISLPQPGPAFRSWQPWDGALAASYPATRGLRTTILLI